MSDNKLILGFALAVFGTMILPVGDAIAKYLGTQDFNAFQIAWGRWVAHLVILTPILALRRGEGRWGKGGWIPERTRLHVLRGLVMVAATVSYFFALRFLPLADAAAILFCTPLLVTGLSGLILGENVGPRRWIAVVLGLCGMLLIVRPGLGAANWGALFALIATCCFSAYFLLTRKLAGRTPAAVTLWFMALVGTAAMTPFAAAFWQTPDLEAWLLMFALGAVMALGHLFIIRGLDHIEASAMAPLTYLEILTATALGYVLFGDFPDALTWTGCAVVIGAGLFVIYRERQAQRRIVTEVPVI